MFLKSTMKSQSYTVDLFKVNNVYTNHASIDDSFATIANFEYIQDIY